jgi:hypothetical protein
MVGVCVIVGDGEGVAVLEGVGVAVAVAVSVGVQVKVAVCVAVPVAEGVADGVGEANISATRIGALQAPIANAKPITISRKICLVIAYHMNRVRVLAANRD